MMSMRPLRIVWIILMTWVSTLAVRGADAPNAIAGWTFDMVIGQGNGPFPSTGRYRIYVNNSSSHYLLHGVSGILDTAGAIAYTRTGFDLGRITFSGTPYTVVFTFHTSHSGTFFMGDGWSSQSGTFTAYNAVAPAAWSKKVFKLAPTLGTGPFSAQPHRLLVGPSMYNVEVVAGVTNSYGWYFTTRTNLSTMLMTCYGDPVWGDVQLAFSFGTTNSGIYLARGNNNFKQAGTFTMLEYRDVSILTHPADSAVPISSATSFTVQGSGTGPLRYQWYKDFTPISGATASSYTIGSVQWNHGGEYWAIVSNWGGPAASLKATLTPGCTLNISHGGDAFDNGGGNGSILIATTGGCPWSVSNGVPWITITSGTSGTDFGEVTYFVPPNSSETARYGSFMVAGKTFVVTQLGNKAPAALAGRTFVFSPSSAPATVPGVFKFETITNALTNVSAWFFVQNNPAGASPSVVPVYHRTSPNVGRMTYNQGGGEYGLYALTFNAVNYGTYLYQASNAGGVHFEQTGFFSSAPNGPELNGDPFTDLLFQKPNGILSAWFLRGTNYLGARPITNAKLSGSDWQTMAMGDFDANGSSDLVLQHDSGSVVLSMLNGTNFLKFLPVRNGYGLPNWRVVGVADFNRDRKSDIVLQNENRSLMVWYMVGTNYFASQILRDGVAPGPAWRFAAINDFNDDGQADVIWQNADGRLAVWFMVGGNYLSTYLLRDGRPAAPGYRLVGVADINFDARNDLLFQHTDGRLLAWLMNGAGFVKAIMFPNTPKVPAGWKLVGPK